MLEEGQSGIPSDNTRLMDELLQHGVLEATDDKRAIWKVSVNLQDWKQELTCLCISLDKLWADKEKWPFSSDIQVIPVGNNSSNDTSQENNNLKDKSKEDNKEKINTSGTTNNNSQTKDLNPASTVSTDSLPLPPSIELPDKNDTGNNPKEKSETDHSILAQSFIDWLSSGIANGSLTVNHVGAAIHSVEEGLLLVSPAIFRNYVKVVADVDYTQVQHAFQSLGINKITKQNTNVWKYVVQGKRKKASCLKGMVISEPEKSLGIRLPPANPVLTLNE